MVAIYLICVVIFIISTEYSRRENRRMILLTSQILEDSFTYVRGCRQELKEIQAQVESLSEKIKPLA